MVAINRAVAIAEARSPREGLDALDAVAADTHVADYQPYWAARARLLARCGDPAAAEAYTLAAGLARDPAVSAFLQRQKPELGSDPWV